MVAERTLTARLIVGDVDHGPVVARIVDNPDGGFAGWLLLVDDDLPLPRGWTDGQLRLVDGGAEIPIRIQARTPDRVYFSSQSSVS